MCDLSPRNNNRRYHFHIWQGHNYEAVKRYNIN